MLKFKVNISHLNHKKLQIKFLYWPPWGNVQWSYVLLPCLPSKWVEYVLLFRNATIPQGKYRLKTIKRVTRQAVKFFYYSWHNILERNNTSICICACISFFLKFSKKVSIIKVFLLIQYSLTNLSIRYGYDLYSFNFHKISGSIGTTQIVNFLIEFLWALYCFLDFTERDLHW